MISSQQERKIRSLPHRRCVCLEKLRRQVKVPIMLDESLCGRIDAERAVAEDACDLFNIRLSKCGGFLPSLRLVQFARRSELRSCGLHARRARNHLQVRCSDCENDHVARILDAEP